MSEPKFQPAPWAYHEESKIIYDSNGEIVCDTMGSGEESQEASGRLIEQSPVMHEILEVLCNFNCPCEYLSESELAAFDKIESLLKSVRGE